MNIALVSNTNLHHKYWVGELYDNNNVSLIIHPTGNQKSMFSLIKQKRLGYYGRLHMFLKLLSLLYGMFSGKGLKKSIRNAEEKYFLNKIGGYSRIPDKIIHFVETVNSRYAIELIKANKIDIICFLGGDIAGKEFIDAAKLCLNYHSGISPLYNGTKTNFHAVSDFRPNFTGGTLMKMNERIDGGEILMHYINPIEEGDKAEDLFMKGIIGAVKTYNYFLNKKESDIKGIQQKRSFKYVRNIDWTIINDIKLQKFHKYKRMKIYSRPEKILNYVNKGYSLDKMYGALLKEILG